MPTNVQSQRCEQRPQTPAHSCCHHPYHRAKSLSGKRPQSPCLPPHPLFSLSAFSSKFRTAVFGWCCLGYMPEPQLHKSLGNQASDIFHFCNGRAHAPPRLMRWEIPKYTEEFQMLQNKKNDQYHSLQQLLSGVMEELVCRIEPRYRRKKSQEMERQTKPR